LTKKVLVKNLTIRVLIKNVEELTRRLEKLEKENKILRHENVMLTAANAELKIEVADLMARLDSNSHNSNKPPSSDGYKSNL
jgi:predicted RNase H-like nuclease (RuvC/YqgF family)